jgi:hypothetical protein
MMRFVRCLCMFTSILLLAIPTFSQSRNTGEIRGTVSAGGAVVLGATVTVTNIDTGETKNFVTNQDGIYDTVSTPAGNYNISFSAQGFKKLVRGPVTLQVDVITENATLDVGAVTETVTVTAEGAPLLMPKPSASCPRSAPESPATTGPTSTSFSPALGALPRSPPRRAAVLITLEMPSLSTGTCLITRTTSRTGV